MKIFSHFLNLIFFLHVVLLCGLTIWYYLRFYHAIFPVLRYYNISIILLDFFFTFLISCLQIIYKKIRVTAFEPTALLAERVQNISI